MPCAPAGKYHQGMTGRALGPFQVWQSLNSVADACSSPYSVVGAAFNPPSEEPDTDIRQPLRSKEGLPSSTVANRQSSRHPLPMGSKIDNPVRHAARRGGTGCAHLLNEAKAWPTKINNHTTPDTVCHVIQGRRKEKRRPESFEGPSIPLVFSYFSHL